MAYRLFKNSTADCAELGGGAGSGLTGRVSGGGLGLKAVVVTAVTAIRTIIRMPWATTTSPM